MKKLLLCVSCAVLGICAALGLMAWRHVPRIAPGVSVAGVDLSSLTRSEAESKLRNWWMREGSAQRTWRLKEAPRAKLLASLSDLQVSFDSTATLDRVAYESFWDSASRIVGLAAVSVRSIDPALRLGPKCAKLLQPWIDQSIEGSAPARAVLREGVIVRTPESTPCVLDSQKLSASIAHAVIGSRDVLVPVQEGPKSVSDASLGEIREVVAEWTTKFPVGQTSRNINIKLAAERLDGVVIPAGGEFSFNGVLGERTAKQGFKLAGIYRNGRHDLGIGGGICQVSGTLYNAALLANLKIVSRKNHSMPVPYLPVGRDATVDYHASDLRFLNSSSTPIAVSSTYQPGRLTFRILGTKDPGMRVKIVTRDHKSWPRGVKYVLDPKLPAGKQKVVEKGSSGHSIYTDRIVLRGDVEIARESLGRSHYAGAVRIVAYNGPHPVQAPGAAATTKPASTPASSSIPVALPPR